MFHKCQHLGPDSIRCPLNASDGGRYCCVHVQEQGIRNRSQSSGHPYIKSFIFTVTFLVLGVAAWGLLSNLSPGVPYLKTGSSLDPMTALQEQIAALDTQSDEGLSSSGFELPESLGRRLVNSNSRANLSFIRLDFIRLWHLPDPAGIQAAVFERIARWSELADRLFAEGRYRRDAPQAAPFAYHYYTSIDSAYGRIGIKNLHSAYVKRQIARIQIDRGKYETAKDLLDLSQASLGELQTDIVYIADLKLDRAALHIARRNHSTARREILDAIEIYTAARDTSGQALAFMALGDSYAQNGNIKAVMDRVLAYYQKSEERYQALEDSTGVAYIHLRLGRLERQRGNDETARQWLRSARSWLARNGNLRGMAVCAYELGRLSQNTPLSQAFAQDYYFDCIRYSGPVGDLRAEAEARYRLAELLADEGRLEEACRQVIRCRELDLQLQSATRDSSEQLYRRLIREVRGQGSEVRVEGET